MNTVMEPDSPRDRNGPPAHAADLLALYDDAVDEVFDYLASRCGDRSLAEDLTADTFLAAVGQVRRERVDQVTTAWLIGIARHKLVDHWRRVARRPVTTALPDDSGDLPRPTTADDVWDAVLERHHVEDVMNGLGPHHRSALVLRYYDGLPVPAVAEHLGRTVAAPEVLLTRARRRFRELYERQEVPR